MGATECIADASLVIGIHEGEQEADRDRFDLLRLQPGDRLRHRAVVQRQAYLAARADSLTDLGRSALRREQAWLLEAKIEDRWAVRADLLHRLVDGPEARGYGQPSSRTSLLEQRVGGNRGAVREEIDLFWPHALRRQDLQSVHHGARGVVGRGGHLQDAILASLFVKQDEVAERAARIDRESVACHGRWEMGDGRWEMGDEGCPRLA